MNCAGFIESLSDYIDGVLVGERRAEVEAHVAGCPSCHVVLDTTRCTLLLSRAARTTALDRDRRAALLRRLKAVCGGCSSDGRDEG